jgi:cellulose synthase/poly-beta-1,6-N-acetylglucosamine synthase-like glycosyltransferase
MAELIFVCSVFLLLHTYFLYPVILLVMDGAAQVWATLKYFRSGGERRQPRVDNFLPTVSMVVAAYNEVDCIDEKLKNTLSLDYPADRFELIVGSDGSDDGTDARVKSCKDKRVKLSAAARAGKTSVLNRCVPSAQGEIVVLTDANTRVDAQAIRKLVRHFKDPDVGAVCGKLKLLTRASRSTKRARTGPMSRRLSSSKAGEALSLEPMVGSMRSEGRSFRSCPRTPSWMTS